MRSFKAIIDSPGLVLMSQQTYNLLLPLYNRERQTAVNTMDGSIRRFDWARRTVVVWIAEWQFSILDERLDHPMHILKCLQAVPSLYDLVSSLLEDSSNEQPGRSVVVDNENRLLADILLVNLRPNGCRRRRLQSLGRLEHLGQGLF